MIPSNLRRDEEAVSAAVATVLLFGGVISIIGIMLLSLMPIIQELEGSLKRNDMQAQMEIMRMKSHCCLNLAYLATRVR